MLKSNNIQYKKIKNKYKKNSKIKNFFKSKNDLQQFKEIIKDGNIINGCIINNNFNNEYAYLYFESLSNRNFIIIDLSNKKIIRKIQINISNINFNSILNLNNKHLILKSFDSLYIFDTRINKIISKYSNLPNEKLYFSSIKTFFSLENNFYCLFFA